MESRSNLINILSTLTEWKTSLIENESELDLSSYTTEAAQAMIKWLYTGEKSYQILRCKYIANHQTEGKI